MFGKVGACLRVIVALKRTRNMEWSQAAATSHFFLTHSKRCAAQHLAKYLPAGMFAGVARCSDARAQHFWLWRSAKTDACSSSIPTSKKHLPISIRWLLSETECCTRCEWTAPEDVRHAERPGSGICRFGVDRGRST